jgi:hypothetical protein
MARHLIAPQLDASSMDNLELLIETLGHGHNTIGTQDLEPNNYRVTGV